MTEPITDIPMALVLFGGAFVVGMVLLAHHLVWRVRAISIQGTYRGWKDVSHLTDRSGGGFLYQREIAYTCPLTHRSTIHHDASSSTTSDWRQIGDAVRLLVACAAPHSVRSASEWWVGLWLRFTVTLVAGAMAIWWWPT